MWLRQKLLKLEFLLLAAEAGRAQSAVGSTCEVSMQHEQVGGKMERERG